MDKLPVENIDIERNKELFEYEMTEVIIKLKGEFAAFSGNGTKYAELAVDDSKLAVSPCTLPEVDTAECGVSAPSVNRIPMWAPPGLNVETHGVTAPAVGSSFAWMPPEAVDRKPVEVSFPAVVNMMAVDLKSDPIAPVTLPSLPKTDIKPVAVANIPLGTDTLKPFDIPAAAKTINLPDMTVHTDAVSVCLPQLSNAYFSMPQYDGTQSVGVELPKSVRTAFDIAPVKLSDISVNLPNTDVKMPQGEIPEEKPLSWKHIEIPEAGSFAQKSTCEITDMALFSNVSVPEIPTAHIVTETEASTVVPSVIAPNAVVPVLKTAFGTFTNTVGLLSVPVDDIPLPELPDTAGVEREILAMLAAGK